MECAEFFNNDSEIIFSYGEQIAKISSDGSNIQNLTRGCYPNVSNDDSKIVYTSFQKDWDIYIMDIDGENIVNLTDNDVTDFDPSFSPDGSKIVFYSERKGNSDIYIMNSDGSGERRLTENSGYDEFPIFSPDGKKIAYYAQYGENWYISIMNINGTNKISITGE